MALVFRSFQVQSGLYRPCCKSLTICVSQSNYSIMGHSQSSQHVPNPTEDWKTRIDATKVCSSPIEKATNWKLNSIASLPVPPYTLFCAKNASVYHYNIAENTDTLEPVGILPGKAPEDDSINQIRVLKIGGIYRLVAVFDSGLILLWDPLQLSVYPLKLHNDSISTWSLAADPLAPFLYVGSNGHNVASFNLSEHNIQASRDIIMSHDHNVPCVDVSPCGQFLATASIDASICLTHIPSKVVLGKVKMVEWGWSCLWIPKAQIRCWTPKNRTDWISTIFSTDPLVPCLDNVDVSHYELLNEDPALDDAPPAKKRVLNMEGIQIENLEQMEIVEEEDGEVEPEEDGEIAVEAIENGFGEMEEDEEEGDIPAQRRRMAIAVDEEEEGDGSAISGPFRQFSTTQKSGEKGKVAVSAPSEYVVLGASFNELLLFDDHLKMLTRVTNPLPSIHEGAMVLSMMERFFFLFWIPEWSVVLSANQGIPMVYISTLQFNTLSCQYEICPELTLPELCDEQSSEHSFFTLSGVSCYRVDEDPSQPSETGFFYRLHLRLGNLLTYELRLTDGKVTASPSPVASSSTQPD